MQSKNWIKIWNGKKGRRFNTISERNNIALDMIEGHILLDIGCGKGDLMRELVDKDKEAHGIDFAENMLKFCKGLNALKSDARNLPYTDNFFDCIIALGLIEYLETDESLAKEIFRVLKPKGNAIIFLFFLRSKKVKNENS